MKKLLVIKIAIATFCLLTTFMAVGTVFALSSYQNTFNSTYGTSGTALNTCGVCHINPGGGGTRNAFGNDFANASIGNHTFNTALNNRDSDGDTYTNLTEINARTFPGDAASHPTTGGGGTADTTAPTVTTFTVPSTATSLTVGISSFTASDNVAVTGYLVNESSTKPLATATGWTTTAPTSYTASASGARTLYAWAKDTAGNVSASRSASVTITLPAGADTTLPTVLSFTVPSTATSLTVAITSFTASDNVRVTGYLVNESATKPSASVTGWSATAPNSYTASASGTRTLYAWAKDAAGNVSASRSASVAIKLSGGGTGGTGGTGATGISGQVKDIATGAAISGALVSDGTRSTTTGSSGTYTLSETAGTYNLTISKSGYLTTYQVATVTSGTKVVNWALTKSYGNQSIPATGMSYVIFSWNDLGMHCDQDDYSYFMVLPPYNTLKAQVFRRGSESASLITSGITVNYSFPKKKNSALHTNFWTYAPQFGFNVPTNVGISGTPLSGTMKLAADGKSWEAVGIPITPYDDDGTWDPYGTAVITVGNSSGTTLQTANVVAPVSTEMMCSNCHGTTNPQLDILQKHDAHNGTSFVAERAKGKVHACAECHSDNALGAPGKAGIPSLSQAMHGFHQNQMSAADQKTTAGCYSCHPGPKTPCMRGVMARAGKTCYDCHGDMATLSTSVANGRRPWLDMPKCGDCHGSAHAENANTLYRNSLLNNSVAGDMNNKIFCEACHNGTHAEYITANAADPTIPKKFQGDNYWIWNCNVCHNGNSSQGMHR
jgi:hypothetical protein